MHEPVPWGTCGPGLTLACASTVAGLAMSLAYEVAGIAMRLRDGERTDPRADGGKSNASRPRSSWPSPWQVVAVCSCTSACWLRRVTSATLG
jgi:hypothetical protein